MPHSLLSIGKKIKRECQEQFPNVHFTLIRGQETPFDSGIEFNMNRYEFNQRLLKEGYKLVITHPKPGVYIVAELIDNEVAQYEAKLLDPED